MTGQRPSRTLSTRKSFEWVRAYGLTSSCVRIISRTRVFVLSLHFRFDCPIHCLCNRRFISSIGICCRGILLLRNFAAGSKNY